MISNTENQEAYNIFKTDMSQVVVEFGVYKLQVKE